MKIIYFVLAIIGAVNIGVAVLITAGKIEESESGSKKYGAAAYYAFTVIGIYALFELMQLMKG